MRIILLHQNNLQRPHQKKNKLYLKTKLRLHPKNHFHLIQTKEKNHPLKNQLNQHQMKKMKMKIILLKTQLKSKMNLIMNHNLKQNNPNPQLKNSKLIFHMLWLTVNKLIKGKQIVWTCVLMRWKSVVHKWTIQLIIGVLHKP